MSHRRLIRHVLCTALAALALSPALHAADAAVPVRLQAGPDGWRLLRGDAAFRIKGAGGDESRAVLQAMGGNSFRTWGSDDIGAQLDEAQRLGLGVTIGIWIGHERHGFRYNDLSMVAEQYERARAAVLQYKDHPALLMWAIGNEMEGYEGGDNAAIWSAINSIGEMVHALDPQHPTMTVIAEVGGRRIEAIHRLCPAIDVVGINSYGGVASIPERYRKAGGKKPYVITEFGPPGTWEIGRDAHGMVVEPSSTAKAAFYRDAYNAVMADTELCLGSYAFAWGAKHEATATWYGMFLPDGTRLAAADAMAALWSGKPLPNTSPAILALKAVGPTTVKPGAQVQASLEAKDPDGDPIAVTWLLTKDSMNYAVGGDTQAAPPSYPDAIVAQDTTGATLQMPDDGGGYRLYAYLRDGQGGGAVANLPLWVDAKERAPAAHAAKMPFTLYADGMEKPPYIPAGYMGDTTAIVMDDASVDSPHSGATCLRVEYRKVDGWGGVVWQSPANDWGDAPGGYSLEGARKLSFWVRGAQGGEKVKFGFGIIGADKTFHDTAKLEREVMLTTEWQEVTFALENLDLSRIKTGFMWVLGGQGRPVTFYLDDIRYH